MWGQKCCTELTGENSQINFLEIGNQILQHLISLCKHLSLSLLNPHSYKYGIGTEVMSKLPREMLPTCIIRFQDYLCGLPTNIFLAKKLPQKNVIACIPEL